MTRAIAALLMVAAVAGAGFLLRGEPELGEAAQAWPDGPTPRASGEPRAGVDPLAEPDGTNRSQAPAAVPPPAAPAAENEWMPGRVELDVRDARTGAPLADVWVQAAQTRAARGERPVPTRREPNLAASPASPVKFRWPDEGGSDRIRRAEVFVPGYATRTVDVNVVRGGRYEVPMERSCSVRVLVRGSGDWKRLKVGIADAESGHVIVAETTENVAPFMASGLPPGRVLVTAEDPDSSVFAAAEAVLRPGSPATVTLALAPGAEPTPMRIILDLPVEMALPAEFDVDYRVGDRHHRASVTGKVTVTPQELESAGGRARHAFDTPPIRFGQGLAWSEEFRVETAFVHTAERPAVIELRVPDPVKFEAIFVDAVTGERTAHTKAEVGVGVDNMVIILRPVEALTPGRFQLSARGRRLYVEAPSAHGYLEAAEFVSPSPGEVVMIRVEPIPSLLVGLCEAGAGGAPIAWPVGVEPVLTREGVPDASFRFEYEAGGVRLWVDRPSFWTLALPDLPGYRSGQTNGLWFGADTEIEMVRYGLER